MSYDALMVETTSNESEHHESELTPPYVSFKTFNNVISSLAENGVPNQIDRGVLSSLSGSVQRHILQTFRYLGLIDSMDQSTPLLRKLAQSNDADRKATLREIIETHYQYQLHHLGNGTYKQIQDSFNSSKIQPSVKERCISFLINAAQEAGLEISNYALRQRRSRTGQSKQKVRRKETRREEPATPAPTLPEDSYESGKISTPIPVGSGQVWTLKHDKDYTESEVKRFLTIVKMVLLEDLHEKRDMETESEIDSFEDNDDEMIK